MKSYLGLACVLLITGCGGDTGPVDDFIQKLAQAECQWEFRCCTDAEIMQKEMMKFSDEATCEKFAVLALTEGLSLSKLGVKQGRLAVDKAAADACVAAQANKTCNMPGGMTTPPMACMVDPCTAVFVGSTPANEACLIGGECAKGSHCVGIGSGGTEGVCQPFQKEGEICNTSGDCDPTVCNLYCAHQDFKCHVRSPLGGPCAYTSDPVTGMPTTPLLLECDNTMGNVYCDPDSSTCQGLPGEGEPCLNLMVPGVFAKCDTSKGLFCDTSKGAPGTCSALPTLGQLGVFALGGALAGAAGGFYAVVLLVVTPPAVFGMLVSAQALIVAMFGGVGTVWGPVIGALTLVPLSEILHAQLADRFPGIKGVVYGVAIIAVILAAPEGVVWRWREFRQKRSAVPPPAAAVKPAAVDAETSTSEISRRRSNEAAMKNAPMVMNA